jgi:hypothetical protein
MINLRNRRRKRIKRWQRTVSPMPRQQDRQVILLLLGGSPSNPRRGNWSITSLAVVAIKAEWPACQNSTRIGSKPYGTEKFLTEELDRRQADSRHWQRQANTLQEQLHHQAKTVEKLQNDLQLATATFTDCTFSSHGKDIQEKYSFKKQQLTPKVLTGYYEERRLRIEC